MKLIMMIENEEIYKHGGMFNNCSSLSSLPDISKWNTNNCTNMSEMFYGCSSLFSLPDISKWNTKNVYSMNRMFDGCSLLSSLFNYTEIYISKSLSSIADFSCIYIKNLNGDTILINCFVYDTIQKIKYRIKDKKGIPPEQQSLFLKQKLLEDNKTLKEYNIQKMSTLNLLIKNNVNNN